MVVDKILTREENNTGWFWANYAPCRCSFESIELGSRERKEGKLWESNPPAATDERQTESPQHSNLLLRIRECPGARLLADPINQEMGNTRCLKRIM